MRTKIEDIIEDMVIAAVRACETQPSMYAQEKGVWLAPEFLPDGTQPSMFGYMEAVCPQAVLQLVKHVRALHKDMEDIQATFAERITQNAQLLMELHQLIDDRDTVIPPDHGAPGLIQNRLKLVLRERAARDQ